MQFVSYVSYTTMYQQALDNSEVRLFTWTAMSHAINSVFYNDLQWLTIVLIRLPRHWSWDLSVQLPIVECVMPVVPYTKNIWTGLKSIGGPTRGLIAFDTANIRKIFDNTHESLFMNRLLDCFCLRWHQCVSLPFMPVLSVLTVTCCDIISDSNTYFSRRWSRIFIWPL